jgi:hypothetical protein
MNNDFGWDPICPRAPRIALAVSFGAKLIVGHVLLRANTRGILGQQGIKGVRLARFGSDRGGSSAGET